MDVPADWVSAGSALGGALLGAVMAAFGRGRTDGIIITKLEALDLRWKLVTDELARRITVLENRYQYDGVYVMPRHKRDGENG